MNARTVLSVEDYLHTSFPDLDREYRDGELVERSLPDYLHGKIQGRLFALFASLGAALRAYPCVETRMKIRPNLFLIPDVAVFSPDEPGAVPDFPPLIAIEVRSKDDRMKNVHSKLDEYRSWGVPHVWLVDPYSRRFYTCDDKLMEVATLQVPEFGLVVTPEQIFD
jgi:Uma2 family endonuclease